MQNTLKEPQLQILQFLFDQGKIVDCAEVFHILPTAKKSEAEYHCDVLLERGLVSKNQLPGNFMLIGEEPRSGYVITSKGRKHIMEETQ